MSILERLSTADGVVRRFPELALIQLLVFGGTLFLSATLLFSVQPMFTKMVLPLLGGSPGVWSVAMVFFQAVLLLGYAYAHVLTRWTDPRHAVVIHLTLFAVALLTLPLAIAGGFGKPPASYEAFWLIGLFGASIGLPFFAVAANAPMLQAWFARTNHPQARDPYFLYGASNLGSFCALLAYPVVIEPLLTLRDQSWLWSAGFVALMVMIAVAGTLLTLTMQPTATAQTQAATETAAPTWRDRAAWIALAFVPSALLIAVTSHISTDIAAAPFLWVIPLALFLATFVLTFRAGGDGTHVWMLRLQPYVVAPLAVSLMGGTRVFWLAAILLNLGMFVISTMICHRELYLRRPSANNLTEFYMWVSVGGVIGGIFSGLVAPFIFPDIWEYPILIVLALLCRPGIFQNGAKVLAREGGMVAAAIVAALIPLLVFGIRISPSFELAWMIALVFLALVIMLQARHPLRLAGATAFVLVLTASYQPGSLRTETERSFFGVHKIAESYDGRLRMLYHGTTLHGAQHIRDDAGHPVTGKPDLLTYYYPGGPMPEAVVSMRDAKGVLGNVAVVGLGTGSLSCYAKTGENWTYFEIDPAVIRIAQDRSKFRFISDCAPDTRIVLGDARLTLAEEKASFDLIVLDAFSSDAIPVHLLTQEALGMYLSKLRPGGAIVFHISNRYLELASVLAEVARTHHLVTWLKTDIVPDGEDAKKRMHMSSLVAVVARRDEDLSAFRTRSGWKPFKPKEAVRPWTDDYSDILSSIWRMRRLAQ